MDRRPLYVRCRGLDEQIQDQLGAGHIITQILFLSAFERLLLPHLIETFGADLSKPPFEWLGL